MITFLLIIIALLVLYIAVQMGLLGLFESDEPLPVRDREPGRISRAIDAIDRFFSYTPFK